MDVNDKDLRNSVDRVDRKLNALYSKWMKHFEKTDMEPIITDDFVFTEYEERAWFNAEHDFTKRIATGIPTKQRRRVTSCNNIYIELLLKVTNTANVR